jgi:hypothetical protein
MVDIIQMEDGMLFMISSFFIDLEIDDSLPVAIGVRANAKSGLVHLIIYSIN